MPDKPEFVKHLAVSDDDVKRENFQQQLLSDMDECLNAQEHICKILSDFFVQKGLDTDDQV